MIDTHCHLYYEDFAADLPEVIARAQAAGVEQMITIAVDVPTAKRCLDISAQFRGTVFAAIGVHPQEASKVGEEDLLWLEAMAGDPSVVAIGEIGLDYYRGETNVADQERIFERMLALARFTGLPAVVHHRTAGLRTWEMVKASGVQHGVFHCFSENLDYAKKVLDLGFHISFTGNITYKNSKLPELVHTLPLERLLTETDAPFMAPVPHRGKRCEPMHVTAVAAKFAEIFQRDLAFVDTLTAQSARNLFKLELSTSS
jgi:TatD DNase family protein